jgi:hypothetical protein
LRSDGSEELPEIDLGGPVTGATSAVFTGSGYLLAWGEYVSGTIDVVVQSLGLDGSLGLAQRPLPSTWTTETPRLAWSGSEARITFNRLDVREIDWARLDGVGALIDVPHTLVSGLSESYAGTPVAVLGGDMIALTGPAEVGADGGWQTLQSVHVADDGTATSPTSMTTVDSAANSQLLTQGTTTFAAWITQSTAAATYAYGEVCFVLEGAPGSPGACTGLAPGGRAALARVR